MNHLLSFLPRNLLSTCVTGLLIACLAVAAFCGVGTLHFKRQAEISSRNIKDIAGQVERIERKCLYLDTRIAERHNPEFLQARIQRLQLNLRPPTEEQTVRLGPLDQRQGSLYSQEPLSPFEYSYDLAFVSLSRTPEDRD